MTPPDSSAEHDFFAISLDHLCVSGFDGFFIRVNPSWSRTLGWTTEELMSRPSIEFVHPDDRARTLAARSRLHVGAAMEPLANRYQCKDGSYRWFEWRSIGELERKLVYAAARDITDQRKAEENLREALVHEEQLKRQLLFTDRMASVGTLAAGAAHEINNPLSSITVNLELILKELAGLETVVPAGRLAELTQMATEARTAAEIIRSVTRGLRTFSRAADEQRAVIDIKRVLELAVSLTTHQIQQRARLVTDYGVAPLIEADEARLGQVFVNLLVNAVQAIPEGDSSQHEVRIVSSTDAAGRAVVEVHDTGSGIPATAIARVFDPFFTTKGIGIGTGLGLSISHNLVSALGGDITVTSTDGTGSVFRVVIPAAQVIPAAPEVPVAAAPEAAVRAKVLVVDDEPAIGILFRRVLRDHELTVVTGGEAALALLAAGERYDVILSDLMMPGMSGMQLHDEVALRFPEVAARVVFISGGAFTEGATAFLDRVPNERLDKPFDPHRLRDLVRRYARL